MKRAIVVPGVILLCALITLSFADTLAPPVTEPIAQPKPANPLVRGKALLDKGDYVGAIPLLSVARNEVPVLGDYALLWRAQALDGAKEYDKALDDIRALKSDYPESPLLKAARFREIEISQRAGEKSLAPLFEGYLRDYASDSRAKFAYALYLKETGEKSKARSLFKDLFINVTPFSREASDHLSASDITAADRLKRAKNLNNSWLFKDAEKQFRLALRESDAKPLKGEIQAGLAYAVFNQKRYREAAELYSETKNRLWKAKALFRARDYQAFEREIPHLIRVGDAKTAALLIAYGSKKRRDGDTQEALKLFDRVIAAIPAAKEEALWHKAWTYYRTGDPGKALPILTSLHETYGTAKYLYWKNRCLQALESSEPQREIGYVPNERGTNFYAFLSAQRRQSPLPPKPNGANSCEAYRVPERIELLRTLGLFTEALAEATSLTTRNISDPDLACLSRYFGTLRDFKTAISMATKLTYREEYHELYYPLAYQEEVETAAAANGLDPLLVLAIMREESRFAPDARSIAGARGLMQLMPQTAFIVSRKANVLLDSADDLYQARVNILVGTAYLKTLTSHFDGLPYAIASYNAGEEIVKEWIEKGKHRSVDEFIEDIPYDETRNYVKKVLTTYFEYGRIAGRQGMPALLR